MQSGKGGQGGNPHRYGDFSYDDRLDVYVLKDVKGARTPVYNLKKKLV